MIEKPGERLLVRTEGDRWYRVNRLGDELHAYRGEERDYPSTALPTLAFDKSAEVEREILLKVYGEVGSAWRTLTDVRVKLLGLVPAVSVLAWAQLISAEAMKQFPGAVVGIVLSFLGLHLTSALRIYDQRNDGLYDDLISRGRKVEEELGIDTAIFRGRPRAPSLKVSHGAATASIYGAAKVGWVMVGLWFIGISARFLETLLHRWVITR